MAVDYTALEQALIKADAEYDAAECQGVICGLICAQGSMGLDICLAHTFPDRDKGNLLAQEAGVLVATLYKETLQALNDPTCEFSPLLPGDETDLEYRIQMLGQWCQGLLIGLHAGGVTDFSQLEGDAAEILSDVAEIARADMYAVEGSEQDEQAYMELVEFMHAAVLLLYDELQPTEVPEGDAPSQRLH